MIVSVEVSLDDNVPNYMSGIIRCGSVISTDDREGDLDHQELIDNTDFHSEEELIGVIAGKLGVDKSIVEIAE